MAHILSGEAATDGPGREPTWSPGGKTAIGTSYTTASRVWFSMVGAEITECYFPSLDIPQLASWSLAFGDEKGIFFKERDVTPVLHRWPGALGYSVDLCKDGVEVTKELLTDTYLACVLQRVKVQGAGCVYTWANPHLGGKGLKNSAFVAEANGHKYLVAEGDGYWLALGASVPFTSLGCAYVGEDEEWARLPRKDLKIQAKDGHVGVTAMLELDDSGEVTLGLAFGRSLTHALTALINALGRPWAQQRELFMEHWDRAKKHSRLALEHCSFDGGALYDASVKLLLAHEDKGYPGASVASLSIPWGEASKVEGSPGYHLVWVRDLFICATGLLAAGDRDTPLRSLVYLACTQQSDGSFPQNFQLDGTPNWKKIQLDQVGFPILLAHRLHKEDALKGFESYPMVKSALHFLIGYGPATQQERWEEAGGYSPSTLGVVIASLVCGAVLAREAGDETTAEVAEGYADFLEDHLEEWTVTEKGDQLKGVKRHFVRIAPAQQGDAPPETGPDGLMLKMNSQPDDQPQERPAYQIVDAGFLELVRWGIREWDDRLIVDSLKVVDELLKVETPHGPVWRRYNHDGYGQRADGGPYQGSGKGRAWPLLVGERATYEVAAGRDISSYIRTLEGLSGPTQMLAEQVWDEDDRPELGLYMGKPTGSACPLMWPHSQYLKLLRFAHEGRVLDRVPQVAERYLGKRTCRKVSMWAHNYPLKSLRRGRQLRILASKSFALEWSVDGWDHRTRNDAAETKLGFYCLDLPPDLGEGSLDFAFHWTGDPPPHLDVHQRWTIRLL